MDKAHIYIQGKKFEHITLAQKKLNCSAALIRNLCVEEELDCTKIAGTWYINPASLVKGLKTLQRKRSNKNILISKLRNKENTRPKEGINILKRIIGSEVRKRIR
jgi:hypothetical protein